MNTFDKQLFNYLNKSKCKFVVWYTGSKDQADYIVKYSKELNNNTLVLPLPEDAIKGNSKILSKNFLKYFFLDFPDIIISKKKDIDNLPIIGIEILEQKPVGWNHTQRFSRAAASAILGVPFVYLMPQKRYMFDEYKGKDNNKNIYNVGGKLLKENLRQEFQLLFSLYKLSDIHQIPCIAFFWPIKDDYKFLSEGLIYNDDPELKYRQLPPAPISLNGDKFEEINNFFKFIDLVINYYEKKISVNNLMREDLVKKTLEKISPHKTNLYTEKHVKLKNPDGGNIKIAYRIETKKFIENIKKIQSLQGNYLNQLIKSKEFETFLKKPYSIVVEIDSDPLKGNRGFSDPYSGIIASFDYRYCREITKGKNIKNRDYNLIFMPMHKNSTKYFEKIISNQLLKICNNNLIHKINWNNRMKISDTFDITKNLFQTPSFILKKELKIFFYFSDLIITPQNLFIGKSFI